MVKLWFYIKLLVDSAYNIMKSRMELWRFSHLRASASTLTDFRYCDAASNPGPLLGILRSHLNSVREKPLSMFEKSRFIQIIATSSPQHKYHPWGNMLLLVTEPRSYVQSPSNLLIQLIHIVVCEELRYSQMSHDVVYNHIVFLLQTCKHHIMTIP